MAANELNVSGRNSMFDKHDIQVLNRAIAMIKDGSCNRIDLGHGMLIYKVPSNNPKKYTIRLDIKVYEDE
jgi:hypothetical protein